MIMILYQGIFLHDLQLWNDPIDFFLYSIPYLFYLDFSK